MENNTKAIISCKLTPADDERTACELRMEGSTNMLLNAYQQISVHLLKTLAENESKEVAMMVYAAVQTEVLKSAGFDLEAETKKAEEAMAETLARKKKREALLGLVGKTFEMPAENPEEEDAE